METFKIVVDGIEIDAKRRKQIESNLEKAFLETLRLQMEDVKVKPVHTTKPLILGSLINGREILLKLTRQQEINQQTGPGGSVVNR